LVDLSGSGHKQRYDRPSDSPSPSPAAQESRPKSLLSGPIDKRGRATDVPVPLDFMSFKFLGKMFLVVPLLVALAAHLAEPGLLTKDKSKDQ